MIDELVEHLQNIGMFLGVGLGGLIILFLIVWMFTNAPVGVPQVDILLPNASTVVGP